MPITQPPEIKVYSVNDRLAQDKIIAAVQELARAQKCQMLDLVFMDRENWIVHGNIGKRGPELQLRRVRITQTHLLEEGGKKTISNSF